jgi:glycosyltransferase involved in cell wall biosynthesis
MPFLITHAFRSEMPADETFRSDAATLSEPVAPRSPVRLLHVLGYAGISGTPAGQTGVERVVEQLLEGLEGFEHSVVYPQAGALLARYRQRASALLVREPSRRFDRGFVDAVADFIRDRDIELVLSHGFVRNDFLTALACRRMRRPHVVRRAVPLFDERLPWLRRALYALPDAWTLRHCAHVIACSQATCQRMIETQRIAPDRISVIRNGVRVPPVDSTRRAQARRKLGIDAAAIIVGGIGQLIARKRFADLVQAVARVRQSTSAPAGNVACVILGAGPERETLAQQARDLGVPLCLPGFVAAPWETIATFDVAVLPSSAEGMPLSVLESMALGVPTIVTSIAGTPEVIEDGRSGFLFAPGDIASLAERIAQLCTDAALRARVGESGARHVATHFSLEAALGGFDRCLRRVVQAPGQPP